jgi:hypothetical protein
MTSCHHYVYEQSISAQFPLFPSLRGACYAIPIRLIVGYGFMEHGYAKLVRGPSRA